MRTICLTRPAQTYGAMTNQTNLQNFYSNVRLNGYEQNIISIIGSKRSLHAYVGFSVTASLLVSTGQSHETMAMHLDGSVDMVFTKVLHMLQCGPVGTYIGVIGVIQALSPI
jgi:hypothetical protein